MKKALFLAFFMLVSQYLAALEGVHPLVEGVLHRHGPALLPGRPERPGSRGGGAASAQRQREYNNYERKRNHFL